jgi:hypothetical protein
MSRYSWQQRGGSQRINGHKGRGQHSVWADVPATRGPLDEQGGLLSSAGAQLHTTHSSVSWHGQTQHKGYAAQCTAALGATE